MVAPPRELLSLLSFECSGLLFALDSSCVQQILWLPELTLVEECPPFVAGVINRHGTLLPVIDLAARLGYPHRRYQCSDSLIVVSLPQRQTLPSVLKSRIAEVAVIASELFEVLEVLGKDLEPSPFAAPGSNPLPQMVAGRVKVGGGVLMLLDLEFLFESDFEPVGNPGPFCPEADPAERQIFRRRSLELQSVPPQADATNTEFAVIRWGKEFVGVELGSVLEFSRLTQRVPVPCCPAHIVGNMNLRGNVMTLIDLRTLLAFPQALISDSAKVVVAEFGGFPVGIVADEILEVIDLEATAILRAPAPTHPYAGDFVRGVATYGHEKITVLNLKEILAWEGLTVNQEV